MILISRITFTASLRKPRASGDDPGMLAEANINEK